MSQLVGLFSICGSEQKYGVASQHEEKRRLDSSDDDMNQNGQLEAKLEVTYKGCYKKC